MKTGHAVVALMDCVLLVIRDFKIVISSVEEITKEKSYNHVAETKDKLTLYCSWKTYHH